MIKKFKFWLAKKKTDMAMRWLSKIGLDVVRMKTIGDTMYLVDMDGTHWKLSGKKNKK